MPGGFCISGQLSVAVRCSTKASAERRPAAVPRSLGQSLRATWECKRKAAAEQRGEPKASRGRRRRSAPVSNDYAESRSGTARRAEGEAPAAVASATRERRERGW